MYAICIYACMYYVLRTTTTTRCYTRRYCRPTRPTSPTSSPPSATPTRRGPTSRSSNGPAVSGTARCNVSMHRCGHVTCPGPFSMQKNGHWPVVRQAICVAEVSLSLIILPTALVVWVKHSVRMCVCVCLSEYQDNKVWNMTFDQDI